jgi:protoporphyrinogen oxidase
MSTPTVGIVGGGILGVTAAHRLIEAGVRPVLFERAPELGGLAGAFDFDGHRADRFYHVILPGDDRVLGLVDDAGLRHRMRFRPTKVGFYDDGRLFSMSSARELLTFPLLAPHDRLRLAAFVARCQLVGGHERLDETALVPWLRRTCGRRMVERLWMPLLDSKFDGRVSDLPATYIWARTRRMSGARDSTGKETMGWLEGGYETLIDALAERIRVRGGELHTGRPVSSIVADGPGATGIVVDGRLEPFDAVLCTLAPPQREQLLDRSLLGRVPADRCRYLGVICLVLRTRESVSPYHTLNITDRRVPLTTIVETTHVVDPEQVGGHLVYVTKYVDPGHDDLTRPDADLAAEYLGHARTIFPGLDAAGVLAQSLQRARIVEPVHVLGSAGREPDSFPVPGLSLASTAAVYPEIVNGQAMVKVADRAVAGILQRLPDRARAPVAAA